MVRLNGDDEVDGLELDEVYGRELAPRPEHRSSPTLGSAEVTRGAGGRERLQTIAVGVRRSTYEELVELACETRRPMSCLVRQAVAEFLERERERI